MARPSPIERKNLFGGMDDKADAISLYPNQFRLLENLIVQRSSILKRKGYYPLFTTALNGGEEVQRVFQHEDNSQTQTNIYVVGGKLYKDNGSTQTDITNGMSLENDVDVHPQMASYDGSLIVTDGVNRPIQTADLGATSTRVFPERDIPTRAGSVFVFKEYILFANVLDFDGTGGKKTFPYRIKPVPPGEARTTPLGGVVDLNRTRAIRGFRNHFGSCLCFMNRSIYILTLADVGGVVQTAFNYDEISPNVGAVSEPSIVVTEAGTFFASDAGIYHIDKGQPTPPRYVGKPVETFWSNLNASRSGHICGADFPEIGCVIWSVPYGASQTQNNRGLCLNYRAWHQDPESPNEVYPAFSILTGNDARNFGFNAMTTILSSGRTRGIGGSYGGLVHTMDEGIQDYDQGIMWRFITRMDDAGVSDREKIWLEWFSDVDLETRKSLSAQVRLFNFPTPSAYTASAGTVTKPFDEAVFDADVFASDDLGRIIMPLKGKSRYIEIEAQSPEDRVPFAMHKWFLRAKPGGFFA